MRVKMILSIVGMLLLGACSMSTGTSSSDSGVTRSIVSFESQGKTLHGYLYVPEGDGPHPAVIFNHGSGTDEGEPKNLADFYTSQGFVFFAPSRAGQGLSQDAGTPINDRIIALSSEGLDAADFNAAVIAMHEEANLDVEAAINWLKTQEFADANQFFVTGISFGGIQTLLAAEKGLGLKGALAFAPGAMSWKSSFPYLSDRLSSAVNTATVPIFIIQAENDFSLEPSIVLGGLLTAKGAPNGYHDFPAFGSTPEEGHAGFAYSAAGVEVWSAQALDFFKNCGVSTSM